LEHRYKAERFCRKVQGRKQDFERGFGSRKRRKALKGESQECWELKEASKDLRGAKTVERVAKPWVRHF
jgi:hypothetical protein